MSNEVQLKIDQSKITLDNFFVGHHYSNYEIVKGSEANILDEGLAYPTIEKINSTQAKLKIKLPDKLIQIYLKQNGGAVGGLMAPRIESPGLEEDNWLTPFSGYDDLYTLENLRSVFESVEDYASYPEEKEMFPKDCEHLIVIAQWYRHTLFLDYRNVVEPKVGFVDFDMFGDLQNDDWEAATFWWGNFDVFFSQLLRGEYV